MKQHISVEQLLEFNGDTKKILSKNLTAYSTDEEMTKEVTIGKMIEVLEEYRPHIDQCILINENHEYSGEGWSVFLQKSEKETRTFNYKELADSLWEAVKSVL